MQRSAERQSLLSEWLPLYRQLLLTFFFHATRMRRPRQLRLWLSLAAAVVVVLLQQQSMFTSVTRQSTSDATAAELASTRRKLQLVQRGRGPCGAVVLRADRGGGGRGGRLPLRRLERAPEQG